MCEEIKSEKKAGRSRSPRVLEARVSSWGLASECNGKPPKAVNKETHNLCLQNIALTNVCRMERNTRQGREMSARERDRGLVLDHIHGEGKIWMDSGCVLKVESIGLGGGFEVGREETERIKDSTWIINLSYQ